MTTVADADRAARRAQVVEALADAAATVDHPPPVHVAGDDLVLADGRFLQHPEYAGAWELVVFLREDAGQVRAYAGYLERLDPEVTADVVDLHDPGWPVIRRVDPAVAGRLPPGVFLAETRAFFAPGRRPGRSASPTTTRPTVQPSTSWACALARPPWTRAAAPAGPFPTCGPRSARAAWSSGGR